jgi:glycosyltransferase involved in cell wall biosynthesis
VRVVQVLPGSGDRFYCENCVRDTSLVRALRAAGQDVVVAPLYLPTFAESSGAPVFYGGINAYLQQRFAFFRKTPRWLDRILDARPLLGLAATRAGSVRAADLGEMTLSVLRGADGNQAKELERLLRWLESIERPDVVHLSTSLLLGIGAAVKKRLGVPVVCSLQDEDSWIDAMEEPARGLCWEAMTEGARGVDAFIAVSRYYADVMRERMGIDPARLHVAWVGVDPARYAALARPPDPPVVGYLARLSESQGLGVLAEAFLELKRTDRWRNLRLHLSGGMTADNATFLDDFRRKAAADGVEGDVRIFDEFDEAHRGEFLSSLSVLSVPTPKPVAFGTFVLEALASGVPVVLPRMGSFPELVEATGGGALYEPNDAGTLARAIGELLADEGRRAALGRKGRESVLRDFTLERMAQATVEVYRDAAAAKVPSEGANR